jgi:nicotinamide mononucleotide (NMN) deamidase PncC
MVCLAWAVRGGAVESTTRRFGGDREAVRRESVVLGLQGVIDRAA